MSLVVFPFSKIITALYILYFLLILMDSLLKSKDVLVGVLSVYTTLIQMFGYGLGFLQSQILLSIMSKAPKQTFPKMFS